jgi:DNA-binding phage protein
MKNQNTQQIDAIRSALRDRNIAFVSEATGLNAHTIYRLVHGKVKPNKSTITLLSMYLDGKTKDAGEVVKPE